ncbi:MAG TPA: SHOCT domain-containing protein [Actinomycetota bacterium]|nr:SHOCT domain-containing protein [Actinomycetota bacterium]
MMQGTSTEMMLWMAVLSAVIVGAWVAFGVWAVRRISESRRVDPQRILEERFARGEIDADEFNRRASLRSDR